MGIHYDGDELIRNETNGIFRKINYFCDGLEEKKKFELIEILEFDSSRKRMSVIVKHAETGHYVLYTKGADVEMFKKSSANDDYTKFESCLKSYSEQGWRTLVFAYKFLTQEQFEFYEKILNDARNALLMIWYGMHINFYMLLMF